MLESIIVGVILKLGISFVLNEIIRFLNGMGTSKAKILAKKIGEALSRYESTQGSPSKMIFDNSVIDIIKHWGVVAVLRTICKVLSGAFDENLQKLGQEISAAVDEFE